MLLFGTLFGTFGVFIVIHMSTYEYRMSNRSHLRKTYIQKQGIISLRTFGKLSVTFLLTR
jgi:hypothetical protein